MKVRLLLLLSMTLFSSPLFAKAKGRAAAKEITVPDSISYTVLNYRKEKVVRANQIGIAYLKKNVRQKLPVVVFIHGGSWRKGDKDQMAYFALNYAKAGFVGITISYRLLSEAKYPAQVQDAKEAIRFIKSLAAEYPIDINNIGVCGYSAGAHIALLIGLSKDEALYQSDRYTKFNSEVKCAVGISSPIDMRKRKKVSFLDEAQNKNLELTKKSSPINYLHKGQIPILLFHGDKDSLVPAFHYKNFLSRAKEMNVSNIETHISPEGGHMFFFKESKSVHPVMMKFFKQQLSIGK